MNLIRVINALRLNTEWVTVRFSRSNPWKGIVTSFSAFLFGIARSIVHAPGEIVSLARGKNAGVVFFSSTSNQTKSLLPVEKLIKDSSWVRVNDSGHRGNESELRFPTVIVSVVSIVTIPITLVFLVLFLLRSDGPSSLLQLRARAVAFSLDEILRSYGYYVAAWLLIKTHRIHTLVMSNDHNSINRALAFAGLHCGIETVYVQHAPVTHLFPKLIFTRALLDGEVSAEIYRQNPTETSIEVVGASRYDDRFQSVSANRSPESKSVSLCLNKLDDKNRFLEYIQAFIKLGWQVIARPHPGMTEADLTFLPTDIEIDRSDIVSHLSKVSYLVAGSSGVLLDAYMAGVVPLMAVDLSTEYDYYKFVERGAVYTVEVQSLESLDGRLEELTLQGCREGMVQFNAAIATQSPYDVASEVCKRIEGYANSASNRTSGTP